MRYGVPRLVNGVARDLFREDAADLYQDLLAFDVPELETLESASTWIDRLAADALAGSQRLLASMKRSSSRRSNGKKRSKSKLMALPD